MVADWLSLGGDGSNDVVGAACVMFDVVVVVVSDDDDDNDDKQLDAGVSIAISTDLLILPPQSLTPTNTICYSPHPSIHIISVSGYGVGAQTEYLCNSILDRPLIKEILNQNNRE